MTTPVLPQFVAEHQVLTRIWVGSAFGADRGSNGMPIHKLGEIQLPENSGRFTPIPHMPSSAPATALNA